MWQGARTWANDDRVIVDLGGLFAVADGAGPTYGGYYAPLGLDIGISALIAAFGHERHGAHACGEACMRDAFTEANAAMFDLSTAIDAAFQRELRSSPEDRLRASLRACQRTVRRRLGRELATFAHAGGSVTALLVAGGSAVVGQAGLCRAYLGRGGRVLCLLGDHGVGDPLHYGVSSVLLGVASTVAMETTALATQPGDRFVLCSDGAWSMLDDGVITAACRHDDARYIVHELARAAAGAADDVTIVAAVLPVSP
jgi:serine/threonine protein phosphatase PrpC